MLCASFVVQSSTGKCFVLQSLHKALPSTTLYYKACTKHFPVLLCTTKLAQSTSQYYFLLQSLHKVLPSTTFVLQSLHKVLPSVNFQAALFNVKKIAHQKSSIVQLECFFSTDGRGMWSTTTSEAFISIRCFFGTCCHLSPLHASKHETLSYENCSRLPSVVAMEGKQQSY